MAEEKTVGRVFFLPDKDTQYLFFVPASDNPRLKALNDSMWRKVVLVKYGDAFRATSCVEALEWLRANIGPLALAKEVHQWYKAQTTITPINPIQNLPLYDYQREAVGFLLDRRKAMLSLSPGLGKTLVSASAASLLPNVKRVLVIAPASLLFMWKGELERWSQALPAKPHAYVWHKSAGEKKFKLTPTPGLGIDWVITNPETLGPRLKELEAANFDLLIVDESILYKNRNSQRSQKLKKFAAKIRTVWELTGSPANKTLDDLWHQFHILNPRAYGSYWRFAKEYCILAETGWGAQVMANKLNAEEVIKQRFKDIYFARSQEEVLDIPDWLFDEIDLPMTKEQGKHYKEILEDLRTAFHGAHGTTIINVNNHLSKVVRLIQVASNPLLLDGPDTSSKWEALPELMQHYPAPFIVWTSFVRSAQVLDGKFKAMGMRSARMIGDTRPEDRQKMVDAYQEGKLDAIVIGQAVGSFGLTLTAARTAFYLERTFDGSYFQSLHRFRRIGTKHRPVVVHLRSLREDGTKTIDHAVHGMLDYRVEMIQKLTVGMLEGIL